MLGQDPAKWVQKGQNYRQLVLNSAKKMEKCLQFCNRLTYRPHQYVILKLSLCWFEFLVPQSGFCASFMLKNAKEKYFGEKNGEKKGKKFLGHILKHPPISVVLGYILIFTIIISFNKTTAHLVRPHPFSTLCPTPLGKSPV